MAKKTKKQNNRLEKLLENIRKEFEESGRSSEITFDEWGCIVEKYPPTKPVDSIEFCEYPADFVPFAIKNRDCTQPAMEYFSMGNMADLSNGLSITVGHGEYAGISDQKHEFIGFQRLSKSPMAWHILPEKDEAIILVGGSDLLEGVFMTYEYWHDLVRFFHFVYIKKDSDEWHFRKGESVFYDNFLYPQLEKHVQKKLSALYGDNCTYN